MLPAGETLRQKLDLLVAGITGLRDEGDFHEPNLDGTVGDYVSFDAWEWAPERVGKRLTRRMAQLSIVETR